MKPIRLDGRSLTRTQLVEVAYGAQVMLDDAALRRRLGTSARAFALDHCTVDAMCDAMEQVFQAAIASGRR